MNVLSTIPILLAIDAPFVYSIMPSYNKYWPNVITSSNKIILTIFAVYILLASSLIYIVLDSKTPYFTAALLGATIYGVYSFTIYTLIPQWPLWLAVLETIWGAVMMILATYIISKLYNK